jgi:hypothetical protein
MSTRGRKIMFQGSRSWPVRRADNLADICEPIVLDNVRSLTSHNPVTGIALLFCCLYRITQLILYSLKKTDVFLRRRCREFMDKHIRGALWYDSEEGIKIREINLIMLLWPVI